MASNIATICILDPWTQVKQVSVGTGARYIETPGGAMWGGSYADFEWSDAPAALVRLAVQAEWPAHPLNADLRLGLRNLESQGVSEHWAYGPVNGASPLVLDIEKPNVQLLGEFLRVDVGSAQPSGPLPATLVLVDQEVKLTIRETYSC